jgi:hypothetical protein
LKWHSGCSCLLKGTTKEGTMETTPRCRAVGVGLDRLSVNWERFVA